MFSMQQPQFRDVGKILRSSGVPFEAQERRQADNAHGHSRRDLFNQGVPILLVKIEGFGDEQIHRSLPVGLATVPRCHPGKPDRAGFNAVIITALTP